jgi:hypothetical protein
MQTWFECRVRYLTIDQTGHERKKTGIYLLDAVSYTDAEARVFDIMSEITSGEFVVKNIKQSNITEIINSNEEGEYWYKAKINLISIDEESGKEKKFSNYILVDADGLQQALKRLEEGLSYMLVPYITTLIQLSPIEEVFPYNLEEKSKEIFKGE